MILPVQATESGALRRSHRGPGLAGIVVMRLLLRLTFLLLTGLCFKCNILVHFSRHGGVEGSVQALRQEGPNDRAVVDQVHFRPKQLVSWPSRNCATVNVTGFSLCFVVERNDSENGARFILNICVVVWHNDYVC